MKIFGSFFPSHYDVTEIRDLKTNVKKGQFKFGEIAVLDFLRNPVIARPGQFFFTVLRENCSCYCVRQAIITYLG